MEWFRKSAFLASNRDTFIELADRGVSCLLTSEQNQIRQEVSDRQPSGPAYVATHPGWANRSYVLGNGSVISGAEGETVIVAFEPDPRFGPKGNLRDWQTEVEPIVRGQTLALLALGVALCGPLLRFGPAGQSNVLVEFVGRLTTGKTTLDVLGASLYAGDVEGANGAVDTWNNAPGKLEQLKFLRRDGFLALDEGNLAGNSERERSDVIQKAVFALFDTIKRGRYGDPVRSEVITQGVGFMVRRRVGMAWRNAGLRDRLKADSVPA